MQTTGRGRPRIQDTADDIVASVLATAGARVSTPDFSTRRIAELTGLSQTLVSRACRRIRRARAGGAGGGTDGDCGDERLGGAPDPAVGDLVVTELQVRFPRIILRFAPQARTAIRQQTVAERRSTALMASLHASEAARWRVRDAGAAHPAEVAVHDPDQLSACWDANAPDWDQFLDRTAALLSLCAPTADAIPGDLLDLLARRAGRGLHGTEWQRGAQQNEFSSDSDSELGAEDAALPTDPERSPRNRWFSQVELSVTEQIAIALRREITNSGFLAGDRLSPDVLGSQLGLGRSAVRAAMSRLVDDGLLDFHQGSFRVPAVTGADVVDLYAARLHLGMVLLRACAVQPRHRMLPVRLALGAVEAAAIQGTRFDVGLTDLQFQQELAEASGLSQSARGFHALTLRVRMFIAVLRLDYSPAVERIVSDDRRILTAVLAGDAEAAVRAWRLKLDNAVRHMSALAPESFDAELWSRLSR
ncbi:GntR family transcriptional regulator [Nesterenkonia sp. LB17]|uniref:GntR family transcriptional regulator n=1 Tax=Nesterenkonia sp. LB17 TaxID=2901230 RepID=UPI001F4D320B|nr:GntR family transcriptional regulator [Nesterenkonia sp. LB17]MCH8564243.1 GntR family transcriptional regulator [Nesterenkonia sp. LB17]